jgi:hypothetical protein
LRREEIVVKNGRKTAGAGPRTAEEIDPEVAEEEEKGQKGKVEIKSMNLKRFKVHVQGTSPLITHAWDEKTKKQMLQKQMGDANVGKEPKDPHRDFLASLYPLDKDGMYDSHMKHDPTSKKQKYGFPAIGFKKAAVKACRYVDGLPMTVARGAFHVIGEFVEIKGDRPRMREDMVRIGNGVADIRYRGEFRNWHASFIVELNANAMTPEQVFNLFNIAGFAVGIGEWRPEKDGPFGRFMVLPASN